MTSEPAAGEADESQSPAQARNTQAPGQRGHQAEPGQQAPAFGRAQGEDLPSPGQAPGGTPPPADDDVVVLDEESAVKGPARTGMAGGQAGTHGAEPAGGAVPPAREPAAAPVPQAAASPAAPAQGSTGGVSAQRWSEILAAFVDDPRGSVKMAADAVDSAIEEFVNSVRARQRALASSWQSSDADTEQLRTALREYRRFWHQVQQPGLTGKPGS
jgi:hypothetical protein